MKRWLFLLAFASCAFAFQDALYISDTNVRNLTDGSLLSSGDVAFQLYDTAGCGSGLIYDSGVDFTGYIQNGSYDCMLGNPLLTELSVNISLRYIYLKEQINGEEISWADSGSTCLTLMNPFYQNATGGSGSANASYFFDNTVATYDGNQGGYSGMNALCAAEFAGSHACSLEELLATINVKALPGTWTGYAWYNTGGSKYPLGASPADDCAGWTVNDATKLGSFWIFGTGYTDTYGAIVNCGESKSIACCKVW